MRKCLSVILLSVLIPVNGLDSLPNAGIVDEKNGEHTSYYSVMKNRSDDKITVLYPSGKISAFCNKLQPVGRILESEPAIAWFGLNAYLDEFPAPSYLKRYSRFERPQLLMKEGNLSTCLMLRKEENMLHCRALCLK